MTEEHCYVYDDKTVKIIKQLIKKISLIFQVNEKEINNVIPIKEGMTNNSFLFRLNDKSYILRLPGEGTEKLINRLEEYESYQSAMSLNITDNIVYMDPISGIKVSEYEENARNIDPSNHNELKKCMEILRKIHTSNIEVSHYFDIESLILFYENLCLENQKISLKDYNKIRMQMMELLSMLKSIDTPIKFCHIDPNADNFLVLKNGKIILIDWEYSAMCDPLIDIAMFSLYSYFNNIQIENLMKIYFGRDARKEERLRIYIYMALGGFLWSLWSEYRKIQGVKFEEYKLKMYGYAKEYYKRVKDVSKKR